MQASQAFVASTSIEEWEARKRYVAFSHEDERALVALQPIFEAVADEVIEELYAHFLRHPDTARYFPSQDHIDRLKQLQRQYFFELVGGDYGEAYMMRRIKVGEAHQRIGLEPRWYIGSYAVFLVLIGRRLFYGACPDAKVAHAGYEALLKLVSLDQELALSTYAAARERQLRFLADEIVQVSTPVVQLWDGVIAVPLIGTLDTARAQMFIERTLEAIVTYQATFALVDITGVPAMDTRTAQHLLETVGAVRLMGAQLILTGVKPAIAQTLVHLGIDFAGIVTRSSLSSGLRYALERQGVELASERRGHVPANDGPRGERA